MPQQASPPRAAPRQPGQEHLEHERAARRPAVPPRPEPAGRPPRRSADRRAVRTAARQRRRAEAQEVRRFGSRRFRVRAGVLVAAAALVLLVGVPILLAATPIFAVRTIAVPGASKQVAAAVRSGLAAQLGRPVALVPDEAVAKAVAAVPAVERFTVWRLPPGILEIRVVERTPVAQVRRSGRFALVDAARVTLATGTAAFPGVPTVTVTGSDADRTFRAVATAVTAAETVPGVTVVQASAATPDAVVLVLRTGRVVDWGGAERPAAKAEALRAALVRAARGAGEIDVSSPGVVTTR